jgi:peptidyl-tRNA hydrolase, PTH1 family
MENLHLIVGLGNPGPKYAGTRHNVGFRMVEELAGRWQAAWKLEKKFQASVASVERDGRSVLLVRPQTFMNDSGETVGALTTFYRVPLKRLLVAVDDADLPLGELRLRASGSSGGHHGLESIEQHAGSREFARLRIGIGRTADGRREITGHVLGTFASTESVLVEKVLAAAAAQADCWLENGIEMAMNRFNGAAAGPGHEKKSE